MDILSNEYLEWGTVGVTLTIFSVLFLNQWRFTSQVQDQLKECEKHRAAERTKCGEEKAILRQRLEECQRLYFDLQTQVLRERRQAIEKMEAPHDERT